eukprot:TRINITY_DN8150_c1_g1_i6.p2 TRINITY_DN8150_c1_g1~~TRINITY_DN8150_c1_g1_i6.p2  ORF type:complete len:123 (+),score=4.97 TRINITY_DN8150_c1_g1_i6:253-621(+)
MVGSEVEVIWGILYYVFKKYITQLNDFENLYLVFGQYSKREHVISFEAAYGMKMYHFFPFFGVVFELECKIVDALKYLSKLIFQFRGSRFNRYTKPLIFSLQKQVQVFQIYRSQDSCFSFLF